MRTHGTARGFIAIGPKAIGVFAFGGFALGLVAFGGFALGLVALDGFACGIIATGATVIGLWVPEAAKAISYFSSETVPHYLQYFDAFLTSKRTGVVSMLVFYCLFFPLLFTTVICQKKECRRIKKADPKLVE